MKNNLQRQIKRYLREISLLIPDSYTNKECLLNTIRKNLNDFLKEFADSFLDEFSGTEILSFLQKKEHHNRFIFLTCVFTIISIILAALGCMHYLSAPLKMLDGDTSYYYNGTEVDYEEFMELNTE